MDDHLWYLSGILWQAANTLIRTDILISMIIFVYRCWTGGDALHLVNRRFGESLPADKLSFPLSTVQRNSISYMLLIGL
jgi:hypothetical protein